MQVAERMAIALAKTDADPNELKKTIAYLRAFADRPGAGQLYFDYLATLAKQGDKIGHSKRTRTYLQNIEVVCREFLLDYQDDVTALLQILGWAARLTRYYAEATPIEELQEMAATELRSEREEAIAAITSQHEFQVGELLDAVVTGLGKGNKVTFEILGTVRLTEKEPKHAKKLTEGQAVKVSVVALREDGSLRKVKYVP
ncbi:hypothetical protein Pse7367_0430 [Thalassoporum mexicanum PCC 7367]|nr:hypothetical protein Pse7367_0430 [Pseudanabaena sp. PCC 7367]